MRDEDDQWGITESVGVTALGVASGRAMETHRPDGLVDDPYAEAFVDAAADEVRLPARPEDARALAAEQEATEADRQEQSAYIGVRSRASLTPRRGATVWSHGHWTSAVPHR